MKKTLIEYEREELERKQKAREASKRYYQNKKLGITTANNKKSSYTKSLLDAMPETQKQFLIDTLKLDYNSLED